MLLLLLILALLSSCSKPPAAAPEIGYVDPKTCIGCHAAQARSYRVTGMSHAFYQAKPENLPANFEKGGKLFHKPSDRYYEIVRRGDRYFHRRHQLGYQGKETNIVEHEVHYVMGSGAHARTLIHRTPENRLLQLPLGWYAEKGGTWAMSPGYDHPAHTDFRRKISYDCMFCHNAYPKLPPGAGLPGAEPLFPDTLPEGIDCQRCHGPGSAHVAALGRSPMVNPAKLDATRQLEICMQCHLETTSFSLPNSIQRFDRPAFSYRAGEPMAAYMLHFDHAKGTGHEDKFEIVSAAYRLRQSQCFLKSAGKLTCTNCHSPHKPSNYLAACQQCHGAKGHTAKGDCVSCHMPVRRTEDVVHAVVTDHLIQRRKPTRDLLAPLAEKQETGDKAYRGEVVPYYPSSSVDDLYLAVAQVTQKSNLANGIVQLESILRARQPKGPEFYFDLAQAYLSDNRRDEAIKMYEAALQRDANYLPALRSLGVALVQTGQLPRALETLERAKSAGPRDPTALHELGKAYHLAGRSTEAIAALLESVRLDPEFTEARNTLGNVYFETGDAAKAEDALRQTIRIQPDYAEAQNNLANVLASKGDLPQAEFHYEQAIRSSPALTSARFNYGAALAAMRRFDQAQEQMEAVVRLKPDMAEAQEYLGSLIFRRNDYAGAARHYREAIRVQPEFLRAHLGLGMALAAQRDLAGARVHLTKATSSPDESIRRDAREVLNSLR